MSDLVFGVRINGDASGLVGQARAAREEIGQLVAAANEAGAASARGAGGVEAMAGATSSAGSAARAASAATAVETRAVAANTVAEAENAVATRAAAAGHAAAGAAAAGAVAPLAAVTAGAEASGVAMVAVEVAAGGLEAVLTGGLTLAIGAITALVIGYTGSLGENVAAEHEAADASGALADAKAVLTGFLRRVTEEQGAQNEMMREAIRLESHLMQLEAQRAGQRAGRLLGNMTPELQRDPMEQAFFTAARIPGVQPLPTTASAVARGTYSDALRNFLSSASASRSDFVAAVQNIPGIDLDAVRAQALIIDQNRASIRRLRGLSDSDLTGLLDRPDRGGGGSAGRGRGASASPNGVSSADFGRDAAARIAAITGSFSDTPAQVQRVNKALADLDDLMEDIGRRQPPNLDELLRQGRDAREVIENGINKPFNDFIRSQQEGVEILHAQAAGRDDEAAALQVIFRLEQRMGPLRQEQKDAILGSVQAIRQEQREVEILHQRQQLFLNALDQTKGAFADTITQLARGNIGSLAHLPGQIFDNYTDLLGKYLADQLTGGVFRQLEDRVTGNNPAAQAADRFAEAVDHARDSSAQMVDGFNAVAAAAQGAAAALAGRAAGASTGDIDDFIAGADPTAAAVLGLGQITVTGHRPPAALTTNPRQLFSDTAEALLTGIVGRHFAGLIGEAVGHGLEGAAIGGASGSLVNAFGVRGSQTGAQLGGAIGDIAGAALGPALGKAIGGTLGQTLGSAAGPIGSILGGIAGSLIGGLFSSTKKASATITGVDQDAVVTGNKASYKTAASGLADNVQDALSQIADQLGGDTGNFAVSIGVRKGKYRVDPTGAGRTKAKNGVVDFGDDQAAAVAYAIANAIQDGAVTGLSAAVTKALRSSDDVNEALREALKVDDLETLLSGPDGELAKSFKDFERQAADWVRIAKTYGLDIVKTEALINKQRKSLFDDAVRDAVGSLQDLLDSIKFGDLFEGSAVDQRNALLAQIATAKTDADAGVDGAADKVARLSQQLLGLDRDAFGTAGPELAGDRSNTVSIAEQIIAEETARIKAAQDAQLATNAKLDTSNAIANEGNNLLAEILTTLRGGGGAGGGGFKVIDYRPSTTRVVQV
jgi:hypothetical protein